MTDTHNGVEDTQVLVQFETKLPPELTVPEVAVAVPTKLKRYGLSQVVNHLLGLDPPKPFDFIINGELLRSTVEQHLLSHNISPEAVVKVEYVPVVLPPQSKPAVPHNDWVSAVASSPFGPIISGSYDGSIHLWSDQSESLCTISNAHPRGVNTVAALPKAQGELLLSGGKDTHVSLWQTPNQGAAGATLIARYSSHSQSVTCVAPSPSGSLFCSSSWDGAIHVWQTGRSITSQVEDAGQAGVASSQQDKKRRKSDKVTSSDNSKGSFEAVGPKVVVDESERQMSGHINTVSSLSWPRDDVIYSGGWDHSVRRWDAETGTAAETYNGSKTVLAVSSPSECPALVAFGCSDSVLRLWDVRNKKSEAVQTKSFASHSGWISAVAWRPASQVHLVTGSYDCSVKLWDIRSSIPLATLQQHTDKVLCCAWVSAQQLASGGADCKLQLYELPGSV